MRRICIVWLCALLVFSSASVVGTQVNEDAEGKAVTGNGVTYVPHAPIRIDSNADFSPIATLGDGSIGNPWIIEGWDIDGTGYGYCIYVGNTTDYFVVGNNYLHNASGVNSDPYYYDAGLTLYNVQNGTIDNNNVQNNNMAGIYLRFSSNNTITNNTANSNNYGIWLFSSSNNNLTDNTVNSNTFGIYLTFSSSNTIANNTVNSNTYGIYLVFSNGNTITDNTVSFNNANGIELSESSNNSISGNNITNNSWSAVYFYYSDNNTITNNTASSNREIGGGHGIRLYFSNGNTITFNNASYNENGMEFSKSSGNTITNNIIANNYIIAHDTYGLCFRESNSNIVTNNTMIENGISITGTVLEYWNTHTIDISNTINGKPIYYWKNKIGGTVPTGAGQVTLANCTDVLVENQYVSNGTDGVLLGFSSNNTIANNTILNNNEGIRIESSSHNTFTNNTVSNNYFGIRVWFDSNNNTLSNNSVNSNVWWGIELVDSKGNHITNNDASYNGDIFHNGWGIYVALCDHTTIINNTASSNGDSGITIQVSDNNIITDNTANSNYYNGIYLLDFSSSNTIDNNTASNNDRGIYLVFSNGNNVTNNIITSNNDYGIYLDFSSGNKIYHNNIISNTNQAIDNTDTNFWDNDYPSGGNYWSDYAGVDLYHGPNQDIEGSDGIGDTNYTNIQAGSNVDEYPLMSLFEYTEYDVPLQEGWNLISLPTRQLNWSIDSVLESIAGKYDYIQTYDANDPADPWKTYATFKPAVLNDLNEMNHLRAYWINIIEPGVTLTVKGDKFGSGLSIPLYAGWNLVGYPSLVEKNISDALAGTGYDRVEGFNATAPYRISQLADSYMMKPGEGYWVHVPADTIWFVDW